MTTSNRTVPVTPPPPAVSGFLIALSTALGPAAHAEVPPSYGHDFVTIGSPGNPDVPSDSQFDWYRNRGGVDYAYRIARTELTSGQWFEFASAFAPFTDINDPSKRWLEFGNNARWSGRWLPPDPVTGAWSYELDDRPTAAMEPVHIGFRHAAYYCNWLHNDKNVSIDALMTGAYDATTFTDSSGMTDNYEPLPGAKNWIPTIDEWLKAAHWDPNKQDRDGWWLYPNASDTRLIAAFPEDGGETNRGLIEDFIFDEYLPVGSYPHVQSPWGLLDVSGGVAEVVGPGTRDPWRIYASALGSDFWDQEPTFDDFDLLTEGIRGSGSVNGGSPPFGGTSWGGLRIASRVPGPTTFAGVVTGALLICSRRRR
jgi:hypothetical protein